MKDQECFMEFGKDDVIVVNEHDEWVGTMEKLEAHRTGVLHRAFSVFVLNDSNDLLMQQRADGKYHSGGLWSNTCCSHPIPHESTMAAAHRRLQEEMGFDCELEPVFTMKYKADVGNGLTEHEFDHIYSGYYKGEIHGNPEEVKTYEYVPLDVLQRRMKETPELYTAWLHLALGQFMEHLVGRKERV